MAGVTEIHAAICARVYGYSDERNSVGAGGRSKYQWGRCDCLRDMEVGEQIERYVSRREYAIYRSMASRFKKDYGVCFTMRYKLGRLTITRVI